MSEFGSQTISLEPGTTLPYVAPLALMGGSVGINSITVYNASNCAVAIYRGLQAPQGQGLKVPPYTNTTLPCSNVKYLFIALSGSPNVGDFIDLQWTDEMLVSLSTAITGPITISSITNPVTVTPQAGATFPISAASAIPISGSVGISAGQTIGKISDLPTGATFWYGFVRQTAIVNSPVISVVTISAGATHVVYLTKLYMRGAQSEMVEWAVTCSGMTGGLTFGGAGDQEEAFTPTPIFMGTLNGSTTTFQLWAVTTPTFTPCNVDFFASGYWI